MEKKNVIAMLAKNGATTIKNLTIRNVTTTQISDDSVRLGLTLDQPIKGFVQKEDGSYELGENNIIFTYVFSVGAILRDNPDVACVVNYLIEKPEAMAMILIGATITVMQEEVSAGTEYVNPWSTTKKTTTFDHDVIINHITDIRLTDRMLRKIDKMIDTVLDIV